MLRPVSVLVGLVGLLAIAGCGHGVKGTTNVNQRPTITVSNGPITGTDNFYDVKIDWFASDADGQVTRYIYAKDPPVQGDTAWVETRASEVDLFFNSNTPPNPLPQLGSLITERGYHTFVVKAIDNEGLASAPVSTSFNSHTTAPTSQIEVPSPTSEVAISTVPSVTISWSGTDPDGVLHQKPVKYKFKLVKATDINPTNPNAITQQAIQLFFGKDADNFFATWDSVGGDTTSKFYQGLTPLTTYYFALVAFDEAGAFEPRFNGNSNVLAFRPTLDRLGPKITVFNQFFSRKQNAGGVLVVESRIYPLEFPADNPITFNWFADPGSQGSQVTGYRWSLDLENSDVANETPRRDDTDLKHWSTWSLTETQAVLPPLGGSLDSTITHLFYLEARDNLGFVSLFMIRLFIVKPTFNTPNGRNLLIVDDMYGTPTERNANPPYVSIKGGWPMESEQDTFYYAKGGVADSLRILSGTPGAVSSPGAFSDFQYDTLDYRAWPTEGVPLELLAKYRVVCWYTDQTSSSQSGPKFGGNRPATALYLMNSASHLNTLAVYLAQGGKAWLFGDGTTTAVANGYFTRITAGVPRLPYSSGDDPRTNILRPGNFLYDFVHLQSELNVTQNDPSSLTNNSRLVAALPYLPQYALPAGQPIPLDRSRDPRVGPSAAKTVADGWDGLPFLPLANFRGSNGSVNKTFVVSKPLFITENLGGVLTSVADTLYLAMAKTYDPNNVNNPPSDGKPNAIWYHGSQNGEIVWMGFPLYDFDVALARQVVDKVLTHFGLAPGGDLGAHKPQLTTPPISEDSRAASGNTLAARRAQQ